MFAPWTIPGGPFTTLSTGNHFGCAVTLQQVGYCWGVNNYGQLGNGSTSDSTFTSNVRKLVKISGQP
jgi:alpha-tubulin suppressor-like RCC1 family protein